MIVAPIGGALAWYPVRHSPEPINSVLCPRYLQNRHKAGINAASDMGFLGDFGIGNANEKHTADRIVADRYHQIEQAELAKGCLTQPAGSMSAAAASVSAAPLSPAGLPIKYPAKTASGYCMVVPPGYRGTNNADGLKPVVTAGTPVCPGNQPPAGAAPLQQ